MRGDESGRALRLAAVVCAALLALELVALAGAVSCSQPGFLGRALPLPEVVEEPAGE